MFFALPYTPHSLMLRIDLYQFLSLLFIDPFARQVVGIVVSGCVDFKSSWPIYEPICYVLIPS